MKAHPNCCAKNRERDGAVRSDGVRREMTTGGLKMTAAEVVGNIQTVGVL